MTASSASEGIQVSEVVIVSRDGGPDGAQDSYGDFLATMNSVAGLYDAMRIALREGDTGAVQQLANDLVEQRDRIDLQALRLTPPIALENGFLPVGEVGVPNTEDDLTLPMNLTNALSEIQVSTAFYENLNAGSGVDDDVRALIVNAGLQDALEALLQTPASERGYLAQVSQLHKLMSRELPLLVRTNIDSVLGALGDAGLLAQTLSPSEFYGQSMSLAELQPSSAYKMSPTFFSLPGLLTASVSQLDLVTEFYLPYIRELFVSSIVLGANAIIEANTGPLVGVITSASLSLHNFGVGNSVIESPSSNDDPSGYVIFVVGPDIPNGLIDAQAALTDFAGARSFRELQEAVNAYSEALALFENGAPVIDADQVFRGCLLTLDPECRQLVFGEGFPVVHSQGVFPAPVIFIVYDLATGSYFSDIENFFPGE